MPDSSQPAALPLRPLTAGELLDAAVTLLRQRPWRLLIAGFLVALAEQAVLFPLRRAADVDIGYFPADDRLGQFAVLLVTGAATEACGIALLGGLAAAAAPSALLGPAAPTNVRHRPVVVTVLALSVGVLCGLASATLVAWPFVYGLLGLAVPAAVIDRLGPGRALLRSLRLASRTVLRVVWIRLLGYYAWFTIRLALGFGGLAVLEMVLNSPSTTVDNLLTGAAWLAVNALAYPMLACLDACLHLEARMRTEGLDIALRRALSRGVSTESALVPR